MKLRTLRACGWLVALVSVGYGQYFTENFDSTAVGGWPAGWQRAFNAQSDPITNAVVTDPAPAGAGDRALRIQSVGSWAAYAFRPIDPPQSFVFSVDLYSPTGSNEGPIIDFWSTLSGPLVRLLSFRNGRVYWQGDPGIQIGASLTYTYDAWHRVAIVYDRPVGSATATATYYFDDVWVGQHTTTGQWDSNYSYLGLAVWNATTGTAYFDNVSLAASIPEPGNLPLLLGVVAMGLAAARHRLRRCVAASRR